MVTAAGDVTGLHWSWRMCLDRLLVLDADLRPANGPVLRIFDLGHGEEIRAAGPRRPVFLRGDRRTFRLQSHWWNISKRFHQSNVWWSDYSDAVWEASAVIFLYVDALLLSWQVVMVTSGALSQLAHDGFLVWFIFACVTPVWLRLSLR